VLELLSLKVLQPEKVKIVVFDMRDLFKQKPIETFPTLFFTFET